MGTQREAFLNYLLSMKGLGVPVPTEKAEFDRWVRTQKDLTSEGFVMNRKDRRAARRALKRDR